MLAALVGALEVPGGTLGTTVRLTRPMSQRHEERQARRPTASWHYPLNPTDKAHWSPNPNIRNAYRTMVPLAADGPWSQALGPTHFSWMFLDETPKGLPRVTPPDVWFVYRTNPAHLVLGHRGRWARRWRASRSWSRSPTRATRPTISPTCCCPTRPTSRACS